MGEVFSIVVLKAQAEGCAQGPFIPFAGLAAMDGGTGLEEGGTTAQLVFYKGVQWAEGKHE